ncbi:Uncharacterized protein APZ42_029950 [Daphnia magna]|uniref:Uncharacterized protein n=1 Tax=Daphnia magna TaxID=35525 RepID=A0A164P6A9_9CRUS|nr:Uncharacterized protein APZ42_029950 [Daphnia magna]
MGPRVPSSVLGFFTARNTSNGKSPEPESLSPFQQYQERPQEDFSAQDEPASVPSPCGQEPEKEGSGLPVERSEDLGTADLVDPGHPAVEPLPRQTESSDGVDGTNDPAETPDVDPTGATSRKGIRTDRSLHRTRDSFVIPAESDLLHHGAAQRHAAERQDYSDFHSGFMAYCQEKRGTLPLPVERGERVIHPLGDATAGLPTDISGGHPQSHPIPAGTAPVNPTGATGPRNQLIAEKISNFPGANNVNNVQVVEEIQQTLSKTKTRLRRFLPLNTAGKVQYPTQKSEQRFNFLKPPIGKQNNSSSQLESNIDLQHHVGSPITRFDSGLESFESIVDASGLSEEKTIKILRVKSTDRAFSVIQALLKDHPHDYDSVKEA